MIELDGALEPFLDDREELDALYARLCAVDAELRVQWRTAPLSRAAEHLRVVRSY